MAAGRYGGYSDAAGREGDSSYDLSGKDHVNSKNNTDEVGNGDSLYDQNVKERYRGRIQQKDRKERPSINGIVRSTSSKSDSGGSAGVGGGPKRCDYIVNMIDREPGELSSESGSDDTVGSGSRSKASKDYEISKVEKGTQSSPLTRKRKFSPIIWDRNDREVRGIAKVRVVPSSAVDTPEQLPGNFDHELSGGIMQEDNVQISPSKSEEPQEPLSARGLESHLPVGAASSGPPEESNCYSPLEQKFRKDEEAEQPDGEDNTVTRNISASRWAGDAHSPVDEGGDLEEENLLMKRRKMLKTEVARGRLRKRSCSLESGEVKTEDNYVGDVKSMDANEGSNIGPSSAINGPQNDTDNEDHMEADYVCDNNGTSLSSSDAESEKRASSLEVLKSQARPQRSVNMLQGCRSVDEFERLNKINEGTYGVVYRARDRKTGEIVALKKVKMEKEREGFPMTSLREINVLLSFHHPSIVNVKEVVVGKSLDSIFMVMEYMEHDLKGLMESMKQPFSQSEVKCLMLQLLDGCKYLHDNWVLHRDLKTSNLLLNNQGELKICDFGLARQYGSPLKTYTHMVVTLWYRAPELLLGARQYSTAIDIWSLGCIMAELLLKEPLFNGKTEFDQLDKIFRIIGTPNETIWPGFSKLPGVKVNFVKRQFNQLRKKFPSTSFTGSPVLSDAGFDLLNRLLTYDPEKRLTVDEALRHEWFREVPLPKSREFMPTFPALNAQGRHIRRFQKSPDPLEEQHRRELQQAEHGTGGLFG